MSNLTRLEAIELVGLDAVKNAESESVDFAIRVTDGSVDAGYTEFSSTVSCVEDGEDRDLTMYVLIDTDTVNDAEQLDELDWDDAIKSATFEVI